MAHIAFPNTHEEGRNRPVRERAAPPVALGSWIHHLCSSVPFRGEGRTHARKGGRSLLARCHHAARRELAVKREGRYLVRHCHTCIPPLLPRARYRRSWIVILASCEEKRGETPSVSAASVCCERSWRRRSFHCRQKLPPSSQLLQWSSPVVNGCRRSGCGCRNHTGASGRFRRLRPCCCHRKILPVSVLSLISVLLEFREGFDAAWFFIVDPPELLAAAGAVPGPVRNCSCFVLLFRAVYAAAKMCGAVL
ncbi:uncharacterized protein DS421_15g500850 [Arachis hypogaea]|nr:uncharacterized protein DS421_15g500850 [Arachis hypogaea]